MSSKRKRSPDSSRGVDSTPAQPRQAPTQAATQVPGPARRSVRQSEPRRGRVRFDAIDLAILAQLQDDCKITNATLAQRVGISPPSTLERVKKLEQQGIIRGYVAILDPVLLDKGITALVHVTLREHGEHKLNTFKDAIRDFEEVQAAWHTAGEEDFILKVLVTDIQQYEDFVVFRLSAVPNIGRIRTSFVLSPVKETTLVPLDAVGRGEAEA